MNERFSIMLPYRVTKPNKEYADDIRTLVKYLRGIGIKVFDLKETDILDENHKPVEHVYLIECFGEPSAITNIFSNSTTGHYGETVLFA